MSLKPLNIVWEPETIEVNKKIFGRLKELYALETKTADEQAEFESLLYLLFHSHKEETE